MALRRQIDTFSPLQAMDKKSNNSNQSAQDQVELASENPVGNQLDVDARIPQDLSYSAERIEVHGNCSRNFLWTI